ncbi:predicted protein [Streptomyces viridochromogenes DSM 40736]|uniref:Predicted protein n=1 Tax=Streptomyces viridochromogenes (strain DSM 40736 / JCM 4977 / BCRC 1201 / Tue 494) TaxID=591159 RepID=D9WZD0_STRVT|nr:predicted protein [Streptomyces viridochromogenes DSM 40736]
MSRVTRICAAKRISATTSANATPSAGCRAPGQTVDLGHDNTENEEFRLREGPHHDEGDQCGLEEDAGRHGDQDALQGAFDLGGQGDAGTDDHAWQADTGSAS